MVSNHEPKDINIKNCKCYYFDDIIKIEDFDFKILILIFGYRDLLMMSVSVSNITALNIKGAHHQCIINGISKSEAITLIQNIDLTEKNRTL